MRRPDIRTNHRGGPPYREVISGGRTAKGCTATAMRAVIHLAVRGNLQKDGGSCALKSGKYENTRDNTI